MGTHVHLRFIRTGKNDIKQWRIQGTCRSPAVPGGTKLMKFKTKCMQVIKTDKFLLAWIVGFRFMGTMRQPPIGSLPLDTSEGVSPDPIIRPPIENCGPMTEWKQSDEMSAGRVDCGADSSSGRRQTAAVRLSLVHREHSAEVLGRSRLLHRSARTHSGDASDTGGDRKRHQQRSATWPQLLGVVSIQTLSHRLTQKRRNCTVGFCCRTFLYGLRGLH